MATPDIRSRIDAFVADLEDLIRRSALDAVLAALGGAQTARRGIRRSVSRFVRKAAPVVRSTARKAGKRIRRSSEDVEALAARVLAHVKANAGHRLEEIGRGLRMDTKHLKRPVQKLLAERRLRTEGKKRGTKYFAGGGGSTRKTAAKPAGRKGKKAKVRRKVSGAQRMALLERLAKARAARKAKQETGVS